MIRNYYTGENCENIFGANPTNGDVRMRIYEGDAKAVYKWVFAGNTHEIFNEGLLKDVAAMRLGNFDIIVQATRRNKFERFRKVRNSLTEKKENGN